VEPEGSLPYSQEPATCFYPETSQSVSHPATLCKVSFNIILSSMPRYYKWSKVRRVLSITTIFVYEVEIY